MKLARLTSTINDTPVAVNPSQIIQILPTERTGTWITTTGINSNGSSFVITVQEDLETVVAAIDAAFAG